MDPNKTPPSSKTGLGEAPKPFIIGGAAPNPSQPMPLQVEHPSQSQPGPKRSPKTILFLGFTVAGIFVLLIVSLVIVSMLHTRGGAPRKQAVQVSTTSSTTPSVQTCSQGLSLYKNKGLGLQFCYPAVWGTASAASGIFSPTDTGTREQVSFSAQIQAHINLVSKDWSTDSSLVETCPYLVAQTFPSTGGYSTNWATTTSGGVVVNASRGIGVKTGKYLMQEEVDSTLNNGACLEGYRTLGSSAMYTVATATYYAPFSATITTPQEHVSSPTVLIPTAVREAFISLVESINPY